MNLKQIKRNNSVEYTIEHIESENPGRITNELLFKDFHKYFRDDNKDDPTNFVIKNKAREGMEFRLLPKKCWEIIHKRFDG